MILGRSQVVRHRVLISCTVGSNPTAPAIINHTGLNNFFYYITNIFSYTKVNYTVSHEKNYNL